MEFPFVSSVCSSAYRFILQEDTVFLSPRGDSLIFEDFLLQSSLLSGGPRCHFTPIPEFPLGEAAHETEKRLTLLIDLNTASER